MQYTLRNVPKHLDRALRRSERNAPFADAAAVPVHNR
jgi:hypothetical protein